MKVQEAVEIIRRVKTHLAEPLSQLDSVLTELGGLDTALDERKAALKGLDADIIARKANIEELKKEQSEVDKELNAKKAKLRGLLESLK